MTARQSVANCRASQDCTRVAPRYHDDVKSCQTRVDAKARLTSYGHHGGIIWLTPTLGGEEQRRDKDMKRGGGYDLTLAKITKTEVRWVICRITGLMMAVVQSEMMWNGFPAASDREFWLVISVMAQQKPKQAAFGGGIWKHAVDEVGLIRSLETKGCGAYSRRRRD
ncbi:hypothetical protein FGB62_104g031 [Gracilaria domingensis]|nr:hypothetical protein FGB62_104g031 [Gracilaria domingensis]